MHLQVQCHSQQDLCCFVSPQLAKTVTTKAKWPATDERATTSFFEMPRYRLATSCDWLGRQSVHVVGRRVDSPSKCQTSLGW